MVIAIKSECHTIIMEATRTMQPHSQSPMKQIEAVFRCQPVFPIPRGELWLGSELFERAGLTDTVENHFRLAEQLGQAVVCLPVTTDLGHIPDLGYRYFESGDLSHARRHEDLFVFAVVDGPFQSLVNRKGLMDVLMGWVRQRQALVEAYAEQHTQTIELIGKCLHAGVRGIVIADDLSADRGPLISPDDIQALCGSFYRQAMQTIHAAGGVALVHCCGNIKPLASLYKVWKIDGLAAVQHRINDLVVLKREWNGPLVIMAGIDAGMLEADRDTRIDYPSFERLVTALAHDGGLILGSDCGLYRGNFLPRIQSIYDHVDNRISR